MGQRNFQVEQAVDTARQEAASVDDARYAALFQRYEWLEAMVNHVPDFIYAKDTKGRFLFANRAVIENNGFSNVDELIGLTDAEVHPQSDAEASDIDTVERLVMTTGKPDLGVEERRMKGEGWLMMSRVPLRDRDGSIIGVVGASRDITARKRAEELMAANSRMLRDVARGVELSSFIETVRTILAEVVGEGMVSVDLDGDGTSSTPETISFPIICRDGATCGELVANGSSIQEVGLNGFLSGVAQTVGIAVDRDRETHYIAYLAQHDALTGLANRNLLDRKLEAMLIANQDPVVVSYLDLDNFKHVNDGLGHAAGDELLKIISGRIVSAAGQNAVVSRIGGDEFVVVMPEPPEEARTRLQLILNEIARPTPLDDVEVRVTCSIGVAFSGEHGNTAAELFAKADMALYRVKGNGRNGICIFSDEMAENARARLERVEELRRAIDNDEFVLHFQPQKDVASERIVAVEALVRWRHPREGLVLPGSFIPLAEETGLITPIGEIVLRKACAQAVQWINEGLPPLRMAVNVSARQFRETSLCPTVSAVLKEYGLDPSMLELELTESLIMEDLEAAIERMQELKALGVSLAIDDFGTGYSSLSTLKMFPLTRLKIDRSFITDVPGHPCDMAIVAAIIALGKTLGLEAVAEGIEIQEQLDFLVEAGCGMFQGYHLAKPLEASALASFVRSHEQQIDGSPSQRETWSTTGNRVKSA